MKSLRGQRTSYSASCLAVSEMVCGVVLLRFKRDEVATFIMYTVYGGLGLIEVRGNQAKFAEFTYDYAISEMEPIGGTRLIAGCLNGKMMLLNIDPEQVLREYERRGEQSPLKMKQYVVKLRGSRKFRCKSCCRDIFVTRNTVVAVGDNIVTFAVDPLREGRVVRLKEWSLKKIIGKHYVVRRVDHDARGWVIGVLAERKKDKTTKFFLIELREEPALLATLAIENIVGFCFNRDEKNPLFAVLGADRIVRVFSLRGKLPLIREVELPRDVPVHALSMTFSLSDNTTVLLGSTDSIIKVRDEASIVWLKKKKGKDIIRLIDTPDGKYYGVITLTKEKKMHYGVLRLDP